MTDAGVSAGRARARVIVALGAQVVLVLLGLAVILEDVDESQNLLLLTSWCLFGSVFIVASLVLLGREARRPAQPGDRPLAIQIGGPARVMAVVFTILPSLIGVIAALQVLFTRDDEDYGFLYAVVGVWAMLNSWGLLHWGYAQIYLQRYHRSLQHGTGPTMTFPETTTPRTVDFVYFSFTLGTSFATSDVTLLTSSARWLATWHSVVAFFFNGLIIVFALSTILQR